MFQAIVHAPSLRPGARLCLSDLDQTVATPPSAPVIGVGVSVRFGTCCPDYGSGSITDVGHGTLTLRVAESCWRLHRCPFVGGIDVPGLVGQDWFVVEREA